MDNNAESKKIVGDVIVATAKGSIGAIPIAGSFINEYINLAQQYIADKRFEEWKSIVEEKFSKIEVDIEKLAGNEFFYSCFRTASYGAVNSYQKEKREYLANALINSFLMIDISEEKRLIYFSIIDRYTLLTIKILKYYSENNYFESIKANSNYSNESNTDQIQEEVRNKEIIMNIPEIADDISIINIIENQLFTDDLIDPFESPISNCQEQPRRKLTTDLGDEVIRFLTDTDINRV